MTRVVIEHAQRKRREQEENMDYDKMKALMETRRKMSAERMAA
jgi:hypothetical protein